MSGGGNGGRRPASQKATPAPTEEYENAPTVITMQPAMPGMIDALAGQLGRGFSSGIPGTEDGVASYLETMYRPMTIHQFQEPISATSKNFDKKKHVEISTGNSTLDKLLMGETAKKVDRKKHFDTGNAALNDFLMEK